MKKKKIRKLFNKVTGLAIKQSGLTHDQILGTSMNYQDGLFLVYIEEITQLSMGGAVEVNVVGVRHAELFEGHHVSDN